MIVVAVPELREEARILWKEANELNLIFNAIVKKINKVDLKASFWVSGRLFDEGWPLRLL